MTSSLIHENMLTKILHEGITKNLISSRGSFRCGLGAYRADADVLATAARVESVWYVLQSVIKSKNMVSVCEITNIISLAFHDLYCETDPWEILSA
jgi:hypothetical protein